VRDRLANRRAHEEYISALSAERWARWEAAIGSGDDRALGALDRLLADMARKTDRGGDEPTARELQILDLMSRGHTARSAASELGVSRETVKSHLRNLSAKMDTRSTTQAVAEAIRRRLI
jgi:DNA-binding CsgD family transcriptional regulator